MAHPKRVINFALFFFALFNFANIARSNYPTRTISDNAGQIRTAVTARPNIAYLVATFERDYSRNH